MNSSSANNYSIVKFITKEKKEKITYVSNSWLAKNGGVQSVLWPPSKKYAIVTDTMKIMEIPKVDWDNLPCKILKCDYVTYLQAKRSLTSVKSEPENSITQNLKIVKKSKKKSKKEVPELNKLKPISHNTLTLASVPSISAQKTSLEDVAIERVLKTPDRIEQSVTQFQAGVQDAVATTTINIVPIAAAHST